MPKTAVKDSGNGPCGEVLRDLLLAAASPDNLDAFLRRIIKTLSRQDALGPGAGLAIALRAGRNETPLTAALNFTKKEQERLARISRSGADWPKDILYVRLGAGEAKGLLLARLPSPAWRARAAQLLEVAGKTINGRLAQEGREGQLSRERDIADAITHLEELYLAFPSISLEEISRTVLDEARRLTGSRSGFAGYINPATGWMSVPAVAGEAWKDARQNGKDLVFREFTGLWGWVLKKKKPLLTNSAASDPRAKGLPQGHIRIERFAAAPAVSGKKLIGILALANPPGDYPPAALDAVKKLARVYALMLRHKLAEYQQAETAKRLAESELKYRRLVENLGKDYFFYRHDASGIFDYLSPSITSALGYSQKEFLTHFSKHLTDNPRNKEVLKHTALTLRGVQQPAYEVEIYHKDGSVHWLGVTETPLRGPDGKVNGVEGLAHDITESKRLQDILMESEEKYRALFEASRDALMILEPPSWKFSQANKATLRMFGAPEEADFLKLTPWAISPKKQPDGSVSAEKAKEMVDIALRTGSHYFEWEHKCLYGPVFSAEVLLTRVEIGGRQVVQACIRDISARKRMEELLRLSELRQNLAMSQINGVLWVLDKTLRFTLSRGQGLAALGLKPDQVMGMTLQEFMQPAGPDSPSLAAHLRALQGRNVSYEERVNNIDFSIFLSPLRDQDDKITGVVGIGLDISEKKRMERLLKENEETLAKVFDTTTDVMFIKDANGRFVMANKAFADLFGRTPKEILGKSDKDLSSPEIAAEAAKEDAEVVRTGKTMNFTRPRTLPSGNYYFNTVKTPMRNLQGEITGVLGITRDITAVKKMESELALARAAETVSKMTRPMAHDFNNALAAINGYATLIDDDLAASSPIKTEISRIIEAVRRAAVLTSRLQDFARNPKIENHGENGEKKEGS